MVKQSRPGGKSHSYSRLFFFLHRAWSKSETFRQVILFARSKWQTRPGKTNISLTPGYPFLSTEPGVRVRLFTRLKQQTRPGKNSHRLLQSFLSSLQSLVQEWDFSPGQSGKQDLVKNLTLTPVSVKKKGDLGQRPNLDKGNVHFCAGAHSLNPTAD